MLSCVVLPGPRASELMPSAQNACETRPRGIWHIARNARGHPGEEGAARVPAGRGWGGKWPLSLQTAPSSQAQPLHVASSCGGVFPPGLGRGGGGSRRCGHLGLEEAEEGAGQHAHITAAGPGGNCLTPPSRPGDSAERHPRAGTVTAEPAGPARRCLETRCSTETGCPRPFFPPPREADS